MVQRSLPIKEAEQLKPGSENYRAYVGPPKRFDFMSLTQIAILYAFDLKETDKVLDFGCGSLRAGRMLIPFLLEGGYFGIEPNHWLIDDGIKYELGQNATVIKKPRFSYNSDFDATIFDEEFDFVMAQSIVTHSGPTMTRALFRSVSKSIKQDGVFLLSYKRGSEESPLPSDGWSYPANIEYSSTSILGLLGEAGFFAKEIPWFHPGAQWVVASLDLKRLPNDDEIKMLTGEVIHRS